MEMSVEAGGNAITIEQPKERASSDRRNDPVRFTPIAGMAQDNRDVRFVPKAYSCSAA